MLAPQRAPERVQPAIRAGSPWLLELVAGLVEEGETPAEVAVRETTEESACVIRELLPVAGYFSSPGGTDEYFHLFCARVDLGDAGGLHGKAGEHEDIRLHVIPYAEVAQLQRQLLVDLFRLGLGKVVGHGAPV